jgi:hypothetical protein
VFEFGEQNGRLHVHFACNFFVARQLLRKLWGHGHVDVRKRAARGGQWPLRDLARYLAKYIAKDQEGEGEVHPCKRQAGQHRYLVTQGFMPRRYSLWYRRIGEAYERLVGLYGHPDQQFAFGDWHDDLIFGIWYSFPASCLHPNRPPGDKIRPGP